MTYVQCARTALLDVLRGCKDYLSWLAGVSTGVGSDMTNFETLSSISLSESPAGGPSVEDPSWQSLNLRT